MNKRSSWYVAGALLLSMVARAAFVAYQATVVSTPALGYNATYVVNLNNVPANYLTAQAVYSSATVASATFVDGSQSTGSITVSSYSSLLSGIDYVTVNGFKFTYGMNWAAGSSNATAAANLSTAINAQTSLGALVASNASAGIVFATSTFNGAQYNYSLTTSNSGAISLSGANMVNGTSPQFSLGGTIFTATNGSGLAIAMPVLYSTTSSSSIGGLSPSTTYYAVPVSGNSFMLAKFSTSAVYDASNGTAQDVDLVVVTSTNTQLLTSEHTYTLSLTIPYTGFNPASAFTWSQSLDDANWTTLTASSVTSNVTNTSGSSSTTFWTLGAVGVPYIRLNANGPTTGAERVVVTVVGSTN